QREVAGGPARSPARRNGEKTATLTRTMDKVANGLGCLSRRSTVTKRLERCRPEGGMAPRRSLRQRGPMRLLRQALWLLGRLVLSKRYRILVHGIEQLRGLNGGVLVLPSHPAYIDPVILLTTLWPALRPRPLLFEGFFNNPVLRPVAKVLRAVKV